MICCAELQWARRMDLVFLISFAQRWFTLLLSPFHPVSLIHIFGISWPSTGDLSCFGAGSFASGSSRWREFLYIIDRKCGPFRWPVNSGDRITCVTKISYIQSVKKALPIQGWLQWQWLINVDLRQSCTLHVVVMIIIIKIEHHSFTAVAALYRCTCQNKPGKPPVPLHFVHTVIHTLSRSTRSNLLKVELTMARVINSYVHYGCCVT